MGNSPSSTTKVGKNTRYLPTKASKAVKLVIKGLSVVIVILFLPFITSQCLPFLKPVGESVLLKLWDVLRFMVITSVVSFGIINSQRKAIERVNPWKEDGDLYRVAPPFNHSLFHGMEQQKSKADFFIDSRGEIPKAVRDTTANETQYEASGTSQSSCEAPLKAEFQTNAPVSNGAAEENPLVGSDKEINAQQDHLKNVETEASTESSTVALSTRGQLSGKKSSRGSAVAPTSTGLCAVTQRPTAAHNEGSVVHRRIATRPDLNDDKSRRRSSSVEYPLQRQSSKLSNARGVDASKAANASAIVETRVVQNSALLHDRNNAAPDSNFALSSRHCRSALNLAQVSSNKLMSKKPSRRYTSFSCDFGDDYDPEWFIDDPSTAPLTDPSDSETEVSSPIAKCSDSPFVHITPVGLARCESSPVDISPTANVGDTRTPQPALLEGHAPTSVSPSPGELNRKADDFIARFYERMRMQRVESLERRRSRLRSGRRDSID